MMQFWLNIKVLGRFISIRLFMVMKLLSGLASLRNRESMHCSRVCGVGPTCGTVGKMFIQIAQSSQMTQHGLTLIKETQEIATSLHQWLQLLSSPK